MGLVIFLMQDRGRLAICEVGIHRGANREARHQPPAAHDVEHSEFLGDADGQIVEAQAVAEGQTFFLTRVRTTVYRGEHSRPLTAQA